MARVPFAEVVRVMWPTPGTLVTVVAGRSTLNIGSKAAASNSSSLSPTTKSRRDDTDLISDSKLSCGLKLRQSRKEYDAVWYCGRVGSIAKRTTGSPPNHDSPNLPTTDSATIRGTLTAAQFWFAGLVVGAS